MSLQQQRLTRKVPSKLLGQLNNLALELAKLHGVTLDYSHESIRNIEKILEAIHEGFRNTGNIDGLQGIAVECAAYIVETIVKNTGTGTWYRDDSEFGKDSFPLRWKAGQVLYPFFWCQKRIFDGKSDDVWEKYDLLVRSRLETKNE